MAMIDHALRMAAHNASLLALFPYSEGSLLNPLRQEGDFTYPTLEMNNISCSPQGFSATAPDDIGGIKTSLDMRGNQTGKTFIVKALCPKHNDSALHIHPFITQGSHSGGASLQTFQFVLWERPGDFKLRGYFSNTNAVFTGTAGSLTEEVFDSWHVLAMSADNSTTPGSTLIKLYCDGLLLASSKHAYTPWYTPADASLTGNLAIRQDSDKKYIAHTTVQWAMVFDTVLSQEEIRLFK